MRRRVLISYLAVGVVLGALASVEFLHEYLSGHGPDAALCLTPESRKDAIREVLMQHMRGH